MEHFGFRATSPLILGGRGFAVPFRCVRSIYASGSVQVCSLLFFSSNHLNLFLFPGLLNTDTESSASSNLSPWQAAIVSRDDMFFVSRPMHLIAKQKENTRKNLQPVLKLANPAISQTG